MSNDEKNADQQAQQPDDPGQVQEQPSEKAEHDAGQERRHDWHVDAYVPAL